MAKKSVRSQVEKNYPEFATEVASDSVEQLNNRLASLAKELEKSERFKEEEDRELIKAKALKAELEGPYRDVKKAIQLKSKYVIALLRDKGAA
jgi:hypothetical protein